MDIPYLCIFIIFLMTFLSKIPVAIAMNQQPGGYDNSDPRSQQAALTGWGRRALSAHLNSYEVFPAFAIAVILARYTGVDIKTVSILSITFVVSRVIYLGLYMIDKATLRSLIFTIGLLIVTLLYILALWRTTY